MRPCSQAERVFLSLAQNRHLNVLALCALRKATELLGYATGLRLAELRDSAELLQICFSRAEENALHARLYREAADILAERWQKLPERRRPHYTPEQRYRILRIQDLLVLSDAETARLFSLSANTIARWHEETLTDPDSETVGSLVRPQPPVRRYADVVRHLVQTMALVGFGDNRLIAQTLARAGWKLSRETVRRIRREVLPQPAPTVRTSRGPAVRARYPIPALPFCHVTLRAPKPKPYPKEINTLGDHVRRRRLDLRLLQEEVAVQLGVHATTLRNWERNRTSPDLHLIPAVIEFLGYAPYWSRNSLSERLVASRRAAGISQKELAERLGVDESTVSRWEAGRSQPREKSLSALKTFFCT